MAQAAEQKTGERLFEDNGFTVDYGKFSVIAMKEWDYPGTDDNYAYFLIDNASKEVVTVDPKVFDKVVKPRWERLNKNNDYTMKAVLNTHKHLDHSGGNRAAVEYFGESLPMFAGECTEGGNWQKTHFKNILDDSYKNGLTLGKDTNIVAMHVPCHTRGHVLFYVRTGVEKDGKWIFANEKDHASLLFTGDTLFVGGVGKFFEEEGKPGHEMQINFDLISNLNENVLIFPGHEYALSNYKFAQFIDPTNENIIKNLKLLSSEKEKLMFIPSTIKQEKECNLFMKTNEKDLQEKILSCAQKAEKLIGNTHTWNNIYDGAKRKDEPSWYMAMLRLLKDNFRSLNGKM